MAKDFTRDRAGRNKVSRENTLPNGRSNDATRHVQNEGSVAHWLALRHLGNRIVMLVNPILCDQEQSRGVVSLSEGDFTDHSCVACFPSMRIWQCKRISVTSQP